MELPLTESGGGVGEVNMEKLVFGSLGKITAYLYAFENDSAESKNTNEGERKENYWSHVLR